MRKIVMGRLYILYCSIGQTTDQENNQWINPNREDQLVAAIQGGGVLVWGLSH